MPLNNHLTLSLDYNDEYLGCAHRHPNKQKHIISPEFSSPGFLKHKIQMGSWKAVINLHHIAGGNVDYHIKISGIDGEDL